MNHIIVLSGKQGSGKTTLVKALDDLYSKGHLNEFRFADTIYRIHDFARELLTKNKVKIPDHIHVKDGKMLQWLGTEWGRQTYGEDVWVNCCKGEVESFMSMYSQKPKIAVISDCRFENEFHAFPEALRVRLECPKIIRRERCTQWRENDQHPSEISLDHYAETNKFDLTFQTNTYGPHIIASFIKNALDINTWRERRE